MPLVPRDLYGNKLLKPHQLGWLRRPELDQPRREVWEQPDGKLYAHDPSQGPLMLVHQRRPNHSKTGRPTDV